ncbi:MAG TPA: L-fuculose kinase [Ideonella sp.]|nr:L-fuculose kinase [Ideonella sp.]
MAAQSLRGHDALTLVLDIGKSHAKLLMIDAAGAVVEQHGRDNASVMSPLGYPALDLAGLAQWVSQTLAGSKATPRCADAIASTHGAAIVALGEGGLAWEAIDYEFDGYAALRDSYRAECDDFAVTLAPELPAGLNAARQLFWLQQAHPEAWARTSWLLPYAQFWAWWLSGVVASEVSSLGCHTQLWRPAERCFSDLAQRRGWAGLFAPLLPAWQVLGGVRPERARETGLPETCRVHVGVHDSNACLARHLHDGQAMTLISTGTWVVIMAPAASAAALDPRRDMLANVSVGGEPVPTARFMGGRELAALCAGASPQQASLASLAELLRDGVQALPSFASQGGPFAGSVGRVLRRGEPIEAALALSEVQRASLAALYCAQLTAWLLERLGAAAPVVIEGPFADNLVYCKALAALLPAGRVHVSTDAVEGTARGAWQLAHWGEPVSGRRLQPVEAAAMPALPAHDRLWRELLQRHGSV